jgi:hypothetical protein
MRGHSVGRIIQLTSPRPNVREQVNLGSDGVQVSLLSPLHDGSS